MIGRKQRFGITSPVVYYLLFCVSVTLLFPVAAEEKADDEKGSSEDRIYAEAEFTSLTNGEAYIGQSIPLQIKVYAARELKLATLSYPRIDLDNIIFKDYSRTNPENHRFKEPDITFQTIDDKQFMVITFNTSVTPLSAGRLEGTGRLKAEWVTVESDDGDLRNREPEDGQQSFLTDFFSRPSRRVERDISLKLSPLRIKRLPERTEEADNFLGLVGNWKIQARLHPEKVQTGKPVNLEVLIHGDGNHNMLRIPELTIPGFRIFEPEKEVVETAEGSRIRLAWILIPLTAQSTFPPLRFSTFDPAKGDYTIHDLHPLLTVIPAQEETTVQDDNGTAKKSDTEARTESEGSKSDLRPLKTEPVDYIKRPLWRNNGLFLIALTVSGCIFFACTVILAARRKRKAAPPFDVQHRQKIKRIEEVLHQLDDCPTVEKKERIRTRLIPCLNDLLDMSPGATVTDLVQEIEKSDQELANILRNVEIDAFLPDDKFDCRFEEMRSRIRDLLKQGVHLLFAVGILSGTLLLSPPSRAESAKDAKEKAPFKEAIAYYEKGEYQKALDTFAAVTDKDKANPAFLYNQGNCAFQMGNFVKAAAYYERALKLAPRDKDIRENLNRARQKLDLPLVGNDASTFRGSVTEARDLLRPDEWLTIAAFIITLTLIIAGLAVWLNHAWQLLLVTGLILTALTLYTAYAQFTTSYAPDRQAIMGESEEAPRRFPFDSAEKLTLTIQPGQRVRILEKRPGWFKVEIKEHKFWT
ncbi:MAG: tetratricopeptide repeat protein, partial [Verrucomicrobiota bacterium]